MASGLQIPVGGTGASWPVAVGLVRSSGGGGPTQGNSPLIFSTAGVHALFVPAGVTSMTFALWGGGGGGGASQAAGGAAGAAYLQFTIAVVPLEMLTVVVASGGQAGSTASPFKYGGDGGGFTGVFRGATALGAAAGSGGQNGSSSGTGNQEFGNRGGGDTGFGGLDSGGERDGGAGSLTTPGWGAFTGPDNSTQGGPWRGGDGGGKVGFTRKLFATGLRWGGGGRGGGDQTGGAATGGGGGGGAIFGGGGGAGDETATITARGHGGTGVCYADAAATAVTKTAGTTTANPGNVTHAQYNGTAGKGGAAGANGGAGLAVVTW